MHKIISQGQTIYLLFDKIRLLGHSFFSIGQDPNNTYCMNYPLLAQKHSLVLPKKKQNYHIILQIAQFVTGVSLVSERYM